MYKCQELRWKLYFR